MSESSEAPIVCPPTTTDGDSVEETIPEVAPVKVQTPKRTPSKRKTAVERAQAESEQLLKSMGIDIEATTPGRRTRSGGARSSPVVNVESPAKKAKASPKGKAKGKKLLDAIVIEKDEEQVQENSIESQKEEKIEESPKVENLEEDKVDSTVTEVTPEEKVEEVQKEEVAKEEVAEKPQDEAVEAMEVDSVPKIVTTPPEPEVVPVVAPAEELEAEDEQPVEEINAAQENELNTAEEIKQNEINTISEESKIVEVPEPEQGSNNHVSQQPEEENSSPVVVEQTESSGHCQAETEPPAASSDIVQTPQSCN